MNLTLALVVCASLVAADPEQGTREAPDTIAFCEPTLVPTLLPWVNYRSSQGHNIQVDSRARTADEIRQAIAKAAEGGQLKNVVLVGDVESRPQPNVPRRGVATNYPKAKINVQWGSEPEIASDNPFGDLDGDSVPELAVGRLSAATPDELQTIIRKIVDYEQDSANGLWRRRINFVAGVGGFGLLADAVLESATRSFISQGIPPEFRTSMTYASWRSPYCPDPRAFRQTVIGRFNEGCLCWIYIGHGHRHELDWVRVPNGRAPILSGDDVVQIRSRQGSPIAVFLSCYAGAYDASEPCLAEQLLRQQGGPVAVLAGSRVTMPYGMATMSQSLMRQLFHQRAQTLGEMMLATKREMAQSNPEGFSRRMLDTLAAAISPNPKGLDVERQEHVELFNLLGDPLLRIRHPKKIDVTTVGLAEPGQSLKINCEGGLSGVAVIELVCRRGDFTYEPEARLEYDGSHQGMQALNAEYWRANNDCFVQRRILVDSDTFQTELKIPENAGGRCYVRVFVEGDRDFGMGTAVVKIAKAANDSEKEPELATSPGDSKLQ